ncbi:efflux RND transporter periplasmic adaptor subunit [Thalassospira sp.]|uniref:efflux RND transporter periplasmic adaptor subunit n=1 Tax=Thalassospira sp. TaxID=1912094 RepID=UPI0026261493|nr:efflux RND transporter periplasmic adaptor subunit [Thalassospira sp.]MCH2277027.1 efflux RND transporter periplasmic adaptor subunit [Thalassospira sp.]
MRRKRLFLFGAVALAAVGAIGFAVLSQSAPGEASAATDPREAPVLVKVARAAGVHGAERSFTGTVAARVQSNLGFRVPGKIVERFVDVGQQVEAGQPLMRLDETDLQLALTAKRNAVAAARASFVQAQADEKRYAALVKDGLAASRQRYEQVKAIRDTAQAQLAAAQADAKVAENEATYSTLLADADGTVVATLGEPGQVIAAGQTVIQLAHAGPREAVIALPETIRPEIGSVAIASVYGQNEAHGNARLRQISDAADPLTRTYESRYVLEGKAASAPLGATVTVSIASQSQQAGVVVPIGAVLDDGRRTGVWTITQDSASVQFVPVQIRKLGEETAIVTGINEGQEIVALGAHLLADGTAIRTTLQAEAAN